ncbi:MAG: hypothetical protein QM679_09530 [Patulibacter sp.]
MALATTTAYSAVASMSGNGCWVVAASVRDPRNAGVSRERTWSGRIGSKAIHRHDFGKALYATQPTTAIDGAGRAYVLWRSQTPGPDYTISSTAPWHLHATSIDPSGKHVTAVQRIADGKGFSAFSVAASPNSGAVIEYSDATFHSHVSMFGTDGLLMPVTGGPPPDSDPGPVAYGATGIPYVFWRDSKANKIYASLVDGTTLQLPEDTDAPDTPDNVVVSSSPSGQPRLYWIDAQSATPQLRSSTRLP